MNEPQCTPDFFLLANLMPERTGLAFCVWISSKDASSDDVRLWASRTPKAVPSEMVSVSIQPDVRVVEGKMTASDLNLLRQWVELNLRTLVRYWKGEMDTKDAINAIHSIKR